MASRSLTDTEARHSNIERECLAVMFGLEKFEYYLLGRHTPVETVHSPLEQIFKKNIAVPARLQRLLLRCMKFDVEVRYRQGEAIPVADALLSRMCTTKDVIESETQKESCAPEYSIHFIAPAGFWPRGQNPRRHHCSPRVNRSTLEVVLTV